MKQTKIDDISLSDRIYIDIILSLIDKLLLIEIMALY